MPPRILSLLFSSLLAGATMLPAATIVRPPLPLPPVRNLGVTVSLTTSGYEFNIGEIRPVPGPPGTMNPQFIASGPLSFLASFEVINHTRKPIAFEIPQVPAVAGTPSAPAPTVIFSRPGQPNERPVAGAIVQYQNSATPGAGWQEVTADDQGRFSFNVPAGTYTVTATVPGDAGAPFSAMGSRRSPSMA